MVNLHHLPNTVREAVAEDAPAGIQFSMEDRILGTAGCLGKVRDFFGRDRFVVSNGKTYFEQDLGMVLDQHDRSGAVVTVVLVPYSPGDPYDPVLLDADSNVVGFARNRHQQVAAESSSYARLGIYTGVQILEPEVLDWIPPGTSDSVNEIYPRLMKEGHSIKGFISDSYWCECSTLERYLTNSLEVLKRQGRVNLSASHLPRGCQGAIVGRGVHVPSDTVVTNSVIWNDTELGPNSSYHGVIITEGVKELPPDTHLRDVVVTPILGGHEVLQTLPTIIDRYALWSIS
jgi:NDP-sugar pyrophosphorylase family protein